MTKPREKTREELTVEIEDGKKKIRQYENREKMLRQKLSQEERRINPFGIKGALIHPYGRVRSAEGLSPHRKLSPRSDRAALPQTGEATLPLRQLSLTGAEISINNLPAGASVPFIHSHKNNEEIYVVLAGKGKAVIDGETIELAAGDWVCISPVGKRQFSAAEDFAISFACIHHGIDTIWKCRGRGGIIVLSLENGSGYLEAAKR